LIFPFWLITLPIKLLWKKEEEKLEALDSLTLNKKEENTDVEAGPKSILNKLSSV
jgi:hypothetical protein